MLPRTDAERLGARLEERVGRLLRGLGRAGSLGDLASGSLQVQELEVSEQRSEGGTLERQHRPVERRIAAGGGEGDGAVSLRFDLDRLRLGETARAKLEELYRGRVPPPGYGPPACRGSPKHGQGRGGRCHTRLRLVPACTRLLIRPRCERRCVLLRQPVSGGARSSRGRVARGREPARLALAPVKAARGRRRVGRG